MSLLRDLVRFAVVGGFGLIVDVVLFNVLRATVLHDGTMPAAVLIAKGIAVTAAIITNWLGNRWWTFRDRRRSSAFAEAVAFFVVSVTGSLISLACLAVSHYALGLTSTLDDNVSANIIGLLLGSLFRFVVARRWVFRPESVELARQSRRGSRCPRHPEHSLRIPALEPAALPGRASTMVAEVHMRILLVEDDARVTAVVAAVLRDAGHAVDTAPDAAEGLIAFEIEPVDLVVLDVRLPGMAGGGIELCRRIRDVSPDVPILMLTAIGARATIVQALDAGADDYLVKPFHIDELLARVRALLRRGPTALPPELSVGSLTLDPGRRVVTRRGRTIPLSPKEFAVLDYLMRHPDTVISTSDLIDHAWDRNYEGYSNVVPTYIRYLRRKIALPGQDDPIRTHRGAGYSVSSTS